MQQVSGPLVVAHGLRKCFGDFTAVAGVDFEVPAGEAFGFLGPNGAGKSSTMRMIGATSSRSGGDLCVLGKDPDHDGPAIRADAWGSCPRRTTWTWSFGSRTTSSSTGGISGSGERS